MVPYIQHSAFTIMALSISTQCHYSERRKTECCYAECRYAECRYAECRYAECRYAGCR